MLTERGFSLMAMRIWKRKGRAVWTCGLVPADTMNKLKPKVIFFLNLGELYD